MRSIVSFTNVSFIEGTPSSTLRPVLREGLQGLLLSDGVLSKAAKPRTRRRIWATHTRVMTDLWVCELNCGFEHTDFDAVQAHEAECPCLKDHLLALALQQRFDDDEAAQEAAVGEAEQEPEGVQGEQSQQVQIKFRIEGTWAVQWYEASMVLTTKPRVQGCDVFEVSYKPTPEWPEGLSCYMLQRTCADAPLSPPMLIPS